MKKVPCSFLWLSFVLAILLPGCLAASVEYDARIPQLVFAAQELEGALKEAGREDLQVMLIVKPDESSPEAFQIRSVGPTQIEVAGSDATGAMYGGLEVADLLRLSLPIEDQNRAPVVPKGIYFLFIRTPFHNSNGPLKSKQSPSTAEKMSGWYSFNRLPFISRYPFFSCTVALSAG